MKTIYSRNKNVFIRSPDGQWSRLLFFKSMGTEKMANEYGITKPMVRIILTPPGDQWENKAAWEDIKNIIIKTDYQYDRRGKSMIHDHVVGGIQKQVLDVMEKYLSSTLSEQLIHGDYLPYIDFKLCDEELNKGEFVRFRSVYKQTMTQHQFMLYTRANGGGAGILMQDVASDWTEYVARNTTKIAILCGMKE